MDDAESGDNSDSSNITSNNATSTDLYYYIKQIIKRTQEVVVELKKSPKKPRLSLTADSVSLQASSNQTTPNTSSGMHNIPNFKFMPSKLISDIKVQTTKTFGEIATKSKTVTKNVKSGYKQFIHRPSSDTENLSSDLRLDKRHDAPSSNKLYDDSDAEGSIPSRTDSESGELNGALNGEESKRMFKEASTRAMLDKNKPTASYQNAKDQKTSSGSSLTTSPFSSPTEFGIAIEPLSLDVSPANFSPGDLGSETELDLDDEDYTPLIAMLVDQMNRIDDRIESDKSNTIALEHRITELTEELSLLESSALTYTKEMATAQQERVHVKMEGEVAKADGEKIVYGIERLREVFNDYCVGVKDMVDRIRRTDHEFDKKSI